MAAVLYDEASAANNSPVLLFFSALLTTKAVNHSQRKNVRSQRYQGIPDLRCDAFPYVSFCSLAGASIDARCAPLESPIIKCRAAQFGPAVSRERFSRAVRYNAWSSLMRTPVFVTTYASSAELRMVCVLFFVRHIWIRSTESVYYAKCLFRSISKKWLLAGWFDIRSSKRSRIKAVDDQAKKYVHEVPAPSFCIISRKMCIVPRLLVCWKCKHKYFSLMAV